MPLNDQVAEVLAQHGWREQPGVVAVSGGPDSVALLRAIRQALPSDVSLAAAHFNHQLRGPESEADEAFVRQLVESMRLRCDLVTFQGQRQNTLQLTHQEGGNLENVARRVRYDWLTEVARQTGAAWVATGHTADDQAETVLHRLLRGTGLRGLRGIAARRELAPGIVLLRPMLKVRRAQVLLFLQELQQPFRVDASNADLRLTRNRIRHQLLPLLAEQFNPATAEVLARLAEQAAEVHQREEAQARQLLAEVELPRAGARVILRLEPLQRAPRQILREMLHLIWQREGWPLGGMSFEAWDRAAGMALAQTAEGELPGRIVVRQRGKVVQVEPLN